MKLSWKAFVPLFIFTALCVAFFVRLTSGESTKILPSQLINKPFPEFSLPSLLSEQELHNDSIKGKISLINVFGSWCAACADEHGFLMELSKDKNIQLIGINWRDDRENALTWLRQRGNPYAKIIVDQDSTLILDLGVTGAPESFITDAKGKIRYKYVGPLNAKIWRIEIMPIIAKLETEK